MSRTVTPERNGTLEDMKRAWGSEMSASPDEPGPPSTAAGTFAGMQRPIKPVVMQESTAMDLLPPASIQKSSPHDSSSTESTLRETESESDTDDGNATPALQSPIGVAPPPPLRNIPHQTADASPTTSLLFSQQQHQLTVPLQRHSIPKLFSSPQAMSRQSLPFNTMNAINRPVMVVPKPPPPRISTLSAQQLSGEGASTDSNDLAMVTLPDRRVIAHSDATCTRVIVSAPVSTSTPKAKRALFPEEDARGAGKHRITIQSEPELRKKDSQESVYKNEENAVVEVGLEEACSLSAGETIAIQSAPDHRALLQRDGSNGLSSSQSSDVGSSSDSDQSERRDRFDPDARLTMRSLPTLAREGTGAFLGRSLLPPLSAGAIPTSLGPLNLPPLTSTRGARPPLPLPPPQNVLQQTDSLPTYQEVGRSHERSSASATPPNYYSTDFNTMMNSPRQEGGTGGRRENRLGSHDVSNHPIHQAVMEGASSQIKTLALRCGVDYRDIGGRTPLMYAVLGNQPKICELLVKLKADINDKDLAGLTPLLWATYQAKADIIRVLLKNGADPRHVDQDGRSVFHWAMKTPNIHCLKWLCKHANIPEIVNHPDNDKLTALHWGVMSDQAAHIKMFLHQTKPDISAQDNAGRSPLNYAVLNFSPSCIRAILDHNERAVSLIDGKGRTALHYACAEGSADCVRTLLSYKTCDVHFTDNNGTTPLHWAAVANQPGLIQLLLRRGADRAQQDCSGYTPLQYAEQRGYTDCVRILRSYGLKRPGSATSLASRVSVNMAAMPLSLDEHGHVIFRRLPRQFSLSEVSPVASVDRLPADGQAQSGSPMDEDGGESDSTREGGESREAVEGAEPTEGVGDLEQQRRSLDPKGPDQRGDSEHDPGDEERQESFNRENALRVGAGTDQDVRIVITRTDGTNEDSEQVPNTRTRTRMTWKDLLCCVKRTNIVTPM